MWENSETGGAVPENKKVVKTAAVDADREYLGRSHGRRIGDVQLERPQDLKGRRSETKLGRETNTR
jgi:hypothetical protein